jgi:hypothetical protein
MEKKNQCAGKYIFADVGSCVSGNLSDFSIKKQNPEK